MGCENIKIDEDAKFLQNLLNINLTRTNFSTAVHPYINQKEYQGIIEQKSFVTGKKFSPASLLQNNNVSLDPGTTGDTKIHLTGNYDDNLFYEVLQYAVLAGASASKTSHDVIHAHDWLTILAGIEAKKRSNKPLIFHIHALEPDRSGAYVDEKIFAIEKYGMQQADRIIAVSEYTKNIIIEKYGISPEKISIVYNGTEFPSQKEHKAEKSNHHKMVLFLGRLAHQKGPHQFIEAARKILKKRKDIHFAIAGTGGMIKEMIQRVAMLRLGKYIHFTGFLDKEKVARIYRLADVYVMPSVSEPFGISTLEALSHDVPVVISKQSGVSEVLNHAFKVDFWDIHEMANKIVALVDYEALRKASLKNSEKEIKDLTWDKAVNGIINLYNVLKSK